MHTINVTIVCSTAPLVAAAICNLVITLNYCQQKPKKMPTCSNFQILVPSVMLYLTGSLFTIRGLSRPMMNKPTTVSFTDDCLLQKLANVNVSNATGPDDIPNCFLMYFSVWLVLEPVYSQNRRNKLMLFPCQKCNHRVTLRSIYARFP